MLIRMDGRAVRGIGEHKNLDEHFDRTETHEKLFQFPIDMQCYSDNVESSSWCKDLYGVSFL